MLNILKCFLAICIHLLRPPYLVPIPIFKRFPLMFGSLYVLRVNPLLVCIAGIFVFCQLPLQWNDDFFAIHKLFSFMNSHLLIVYLTIWATRVLFIKSFPGPPSSRVFPTSSLTDLGSQVLWWGPWFNWNSGLCRMREDHFHNSTCNYLIWSPSLFEISVFSPMCIAGLFT